MTERQFRSELRAVPAEVARLTGFQANEPEPGGHAGDRIEGARKRQVDLIGSRIRQLRRDRFTLGELAEASGVSAGLLSRLENGSGNPSFAALSAVARALSVDVHTFFEPPQTVGALRKEDRPTVRIQETNVEFELLVPRRHSGLVAMLMTLPGGHLDQDWKQTGWSTNQQFELVLRGLVSLQIEDEVYELNEGDSIVFDGSRRHKHKNISRSDSATVFRVSKEIYVL